MSRGNQKFNDGTKERLIELYCDKDLYPDDIAKILGINLRTVHKWLKKFGIKTKKKRKLRTSLDITGHRFGKLVAIKCKKNGKYRYWICKCDCGKRKSVYSNSLRSGVTKSCGCDIYKGKGSLSGTQLSSIKHGAIERGLEFSVSKEFLWSLFLKQKRKCAISGIKIKLEKRKYLKKESNTASLDRKDNAKGYIEDNVQWVHKHINIMKRNHDQNYFIEICTNISEYNKCKLKDEIVF